MPNANIDYKAIAALLHQRCETLCDIAEKIDFFEALPDYDTSLFVHKKSKCDEHIAAALLDQIYMMLESSFDWSNETLMLLLSTLAESAGLKTATVMWPLRIAVSGKAVTPGGATEICTILGKEETLRRIKTAIEKLPSEQ